MSKGHVDIRMGGRYRDKDESSIVIPTGEAVTEVIYDENQEWPTAKVEETNLKVDFEATGSPSHGTKSIKMTVIKGEKSVLNSTPAPEVTKQFDFADEVPAETTFEFFVTEKYPDNQHDEIIAGIRHLIYYKLVAETDLRAKLVNKLNGTEYPLSVSDFATEEWHIAELDFSADFNGAIILIHHDTAIPAGSYDLVISGLTRFDQQYINLIAENSLTPQSAALSFTRAAAIEATNGKIAVSLKAINAWLPGTALIFDLFNDLVKVGTLTIDAANLRGFNPAIDTYQRIDLPMSDFNLFGSTISKLVIRPVGSWPVGSFGIDYIVLTSASMADVLQQLIDQINNYQFTIGEQITNELKDYINHLIENLTITWEQITGSPEFNQEFKDYIENLIENLTIRWEQIIGSPVLNQTLIDLLNQYKQDLITQFQNFVVGDTVTNELKQYIDNLLTNIQNQLNEVKNATTINQTLLTQIDQQITNLGDVVTAIQQGDSITQEYKDYIEQKFTDVQNLITNITEGSVLTEEITNYIDDSLTELKTVLEQYINNSVGDQITNILGEVTRLISGSVNWLHDLTFNVTPLEYLILSRRYRTGLDNEITIPANTENNPCFAVIYADIFGNVGYILGVAAASPAVPHVNDSTQIALTTIYIAALGTTPGTDPGGETTEPTDIVIYDEGTEWTPGKTEEAGIAIDLLATDAPKNGTKNVQMTVTPAGSTGFENLGLVSAENTGTLFASLGIFGGGTTFGLSLGVVLPDKNTDVTVGDIRTLIWYQMRKQDVSGYAISKATGERINLSCSTVQLVTIDKPELSLNTQAANGLILKSAQAMANGNYDIHLTAAYTRFVQKFRITTDAGNITPANTLISFDAEAPVNIKGGVLSLWGQFSALLSNSGFLINLYNGLNKLGNVLVLPGIYGLSASSAEYQEITVPVEDFNLATFDIDRLEIKPVNSWPASVSDFDLIKIQKGVQPEPSTDETIDFQSFEYRDISDPGGNYTIDPVASFPYKVKELICKVDAGTATIAVKINGVAITGLSAVAVNTGYQTIKSTALNELSAGDELTIEIVSVTDATSLIGKINYTRI